MNAFSGILFSNALAAAVLGVAVFLVTRVWRNPHVGHVLWLVVLLKLVVPPVLEVPVPAGFFAQMDHRPQSRQSEQSGHLAPRDDSFRGARRPQRAEAAQSSRPADARKFHQPAAETSGRPPEPMDKYPLPSSHAASEASPASVEPTEDPSVLPQLNLLKSCLLVWLTGSTFVALLVGRGAMRFGRAVREMLPASTTLQESVAELAAQFGLRTRVTVRLTTANVSPLVWPGWRRATIVLPSELVLGLSGAEVRTVLAHELAHLRRRDHWVRWLEVVLTVVYWWHPGLWLARRELRRCEDLCCDAYVLRFLPGSQRTYAEAMFHAASLVPPATSTLPILASSFGRTGSMKRRIEMVLENRWSGRVTATARLMLVAAALPALAVTVSFAQDNRQVNQSSQPSGVKTQAAPQAGPAAAEKDQAAPAAIEVASGYGRSPSLAKSMAYSEDGAILAGACSD